MFVMLVRRVIMRPRQARIMVMHGGHCVLVMVMCVIVCGMIVRCVTMSRVAVMRMLGVRMLRGVGMRVRSGYVVMLDVNVRCVRVAVFDVDAAA